MHKPVLYRPDIDGLRAIAVLSVLCFHAVPQWLTGGFVGVDVFFVISGYLITGILVRELKLGKFSILNFYVRRARRIFPALILVLLGVLAAGWLLLLPTEFNPLGKHVLAGAGFLSNVLLWREVGYFDVSADLKPLLHLWSLGVEEQYYLLWPLILALVARRARMVWWAVGAVFIASFLLSVNWVSSQPSAAFYLPLTRFWELLAGSALAIAEGRQIASAEGSAVSGNGWRHGASVLGLLLIAIACGGYTRAMAFPGWLAILPVAGAALLLWAGPMAIVNRWLLAHPWAVAIGIISYPLYLWHWPLLAFARMIFGPDLPVAYALALMLLAAGLAWWTTHVVEARIRAPERNQLARLDAIRLWGGLLVVGALGAGIWMLRLEPWSARLPAVQQYSAAAQDWVQPIDKLIPGDSRERVLFMGDSHMQQYIPRIEAVMAQRLQAMYSAQYITMGGCVPVPGIDRRAAPCDQFTRQAFKLAHDPAVRTVVLSASWYGWSLRDDYFVAGDPERQSLQPYAPVNQWIFDRWTRELQALRAEGKRLVIVTSSPRGALVDPKRVIDRSSGLVRPGVLAPVYARTTRGAQI